jgi:hypothetical protein
MGGKAEEGVWRVKGDKLGVIVVVIVVITARACPS